MRFAFAKKNIVKSKRDEVSAMGLVFMRHFTAKMMLLLHPYISLVRGDYQTRFELLDSQLLM